jgi:hypothetical protein
VLRLLLLLRVCLLLLLTQSFSFLLQTVTKTAIEPMLGFVTKVTVVRAAAGSNPAIARPLREQAFASPERLAEVVARVNEAMAGPVPAAAAKARLYLTNPATRAILFRCVVLLCVCFIGVLVHRELCV